MKHEACFCSFRSIDTTIPGSSEPDTPSYGPGRSCLSRSLLPAWGKICRSVSGWVSCSPVHHFSCILRTCSSTQQLQWECQTLNYWFACAKLISVLSLLSPFLSEFSIGWFDPLSLLDLPSLPPCLLLTLWENSENFPLCKYVLCWILNLFFVIKTLIICQLVLLLLTPQNWLMETSHYREEDAAKIPVSELPPLPFPLEALIYYGVTC